MCGIFALLNNTSTFTPAVVEQQFQKGKRRGPEFSKLSQVGIKIMMGFHRLAINGLNKESNQPLIDGDVILICNGEIYNYRELYKYANIQPKTQSDCEIIIHLYKKYGIDHTLQLLDGVFTFILLDNNGQSDSFKLYIARDPYGVRPLYMLKPKKIIGTSEPIVGIASELKVLYEFYRQLTEGDSTKKKPKKKANDSTMEYSLEPFLPGSYSTYTISSKEFDSWNVEKECYRYHSTGFNSIMYHTTPQYNTDEIIQNIQRYLIRAVEKRCSATDRPIACLLSGGLDSSIIAGLVRQHHITHNLPKLETYSIGLEGSEDLKYARMVANHLGTNHTEIVLSENDFLNAIPEVICAIESYDTTSVRASIGNYLIGKHIAAHSNAKVIFNGDGADELLGGYLYMYLAPDSIEFDKEVRRLLYDIHLYDVLRSDKCISSHGLEPRTPYLDRAFVQYYLSIPPQVRFHTRNEHCEKYWMRAAFTNDYYKTSTGGSLLPDEVLWRTKEAFSDGVSSKSRSLYQIIQDHCNTQFLKDNITKIAGIGLTSEIFSLVSETDPVMNKIGNHLIPKTAEQYYYRKIFEQNYKGMGHMIPYFWMPKYANNIVDPSARTLEIYTETEETDESAKSSVELNST